MKTPAVGSSLEECLTRVVRDDSDEEVRTCAETLVRETDLDTVRYLRKSFAATIRHNQPDDLSDITKRRVIETAMRLADELRQKIDEVESPTTDEGEWLTAREAAELLQVRRRVLVERLHNWEERKRYGWPWWDGHRWHFCSLALKPMSRAIHLSSLPDDEPQPELLPSWCEPQPSKSEFQQQPAEANEG